MPALRNGPRASDRRHRSALGYKEGPTLTFLNAQAPLALGKGWGTLYDVVGSVKRHFECVSHRGLGFFFFKPKSVLASTKARFVNLGGVCGSTNRLFGHGLPTMIHCSDAPMSSGEQDAQSADR